MLATTPYPRMKWRVIHTLRFPTIPYHSPERQLVSTSSSRVATLGVPSLLFFKMGMAIDFTASCLEYTNLIARANLVKYLSLAIDSSSLPSSHTANNAKLQTYPSFDDAHVYDLPLGERLVVGKATKHEWTFQSPTISLAFIPD